MPVLAPVRLRPQPGRPPVLTTGGMQEVQCAERVFYLNQQQLEAVHRDPQHNRLQVGSAAAHGNRVRHRVPVLACGRQRNPGCLLASCLPPSTPSLSGCAS